MGKLIGLGSFARDSVTGFEGHVMALSKWLTGCNQVYLTKNTLEDGGPKSHWFDLERIELVEGVAPLTLPGVPAADVAKESLADEIAAALERRGVVEVKKQGGPRSAPPGRTS